jgi:hypothetical protein
LFFTVPLSEITVCGLPAEYCEFGPSFEKCKPWLAKNAPQFLPATEATAPVAASEGSATTTTTTTTTASAGMILFSHFDGEHSRAMISMWSFCTNRIIVRRVMQSFTVLFLLYFIEFHFFVLFFK